MTNRCEQIQITSFSLLFHAVGANDYKKKIKKLFLSWLD